MAVKAGGNFRETCFKRCPRIKWARLVRSPGAELRIPASSRKIGIRCLIGDACHVPFNANLAAK